MVWDGVGRCAVSMRRRRELKSPITELSEVQWRMMVRKHHELWAMGY